MPVQHVIAAAARDHADIVVLVVAVLDELDVEPHVVADAGVLEREHVPALLDALFPANREAAR